MTEAITLLEAWVKLSTDVDSGKQRDAENSLEKFTLGLKGLIAVATATATAVGVAMTEMAHSLSAVYYEAERIGSTTEKVTAFGYAVDLAGGSGETAKADLEKFSEKFRVNPAFREALKTLGHLSAEDMKDAQSAYIAYSKFLAPLRTSDPVTYGQRLKFSGQDESAVLAIGRPKFDPAYKETLEDVTGLNDIAVKSVRLNEAWLKTKQHLNTIFDLSSGKWMDIEIGMLNSFNTFLDEHKDLFKKISDSVASVFFDENGKFDPTAFGKRVNRAFRDWLHSIDFSTLKNAFVAFANWLTTGWLADKIKAAFGGLGSAVGAIGQQLGIVPPPPVEEGDKGRRVDLGGGKTSIMKPDGTRTVVDTSSLDTGSGDPNKAVDFAEGMIGKQENISNSDIQEYLRTGGHGMDPAKVPWCAAFVGASLRKAGIRDIPALEGGNVANAYQNWGQAVDPKDVKRGDVVVLTRGRRPGQTGGHIGLATGPAVDGKVPTVGGNTSDAVSRDFERLGPGVMIRRANPPTDSPVDAPKIEQKDHQSSLELRDIHAKIAALVDHPNTRRQLAMITNERPLNSARQRNRHEGSKTQEIRVTINSTDPNSAAHETARQLAHLQSRTMHDWRKVG